jgi:hypothetical protein
MKSRVQGHSADSASISTKDKSPKSLSMPAVPVLQQQKSAVEDEHVQTPVQQVKAERHDKPFKLTGTAEQPAALRGNQSVQMQPFQLKKDIVQKAGVASGATVQLKKVWYGSATQQGAEGKTHYGRTIHYLTKHNSKVTDAFQENRLLGQERAFVTVKAVLIAAANKSMIDLAKASAKLSKTIDGMIAVDKDNPKILDKQVQLAKQRLDLATATARVIDLTAILPGTPEMFVEMGGSKRKDYSAELKKPANFGAGTPTKVVTNFAENDTTMLSIAGQMVDTKRGELEPVVGEAAATPEQKKGIIIQTGPISADFKKHTLVGPGTVVTELIKDEPKNASFSFVAKEVPGTLPENVPAPVTLLVESGFITP